MLADVVQEARPAWNRCRNQSSLAEVRPPCGFNVCGGWLSFARRFARPAAGGVPLFRRIGPSPNGERAGPTLCSPFVVVACLLRPVRRARPFSVAGLAVLARPRSLPGGSGPCFVFGACCRRSSSLATGSAAYRRAVTCRRFVAGTVQLRCCCLGLPATAAASRPWLAIGRRRPCRRTVGPAASGVVPAAVLSRVVFGAVSPPVE